MVVERCNRQFGCETIHLTQKFTTMNLLQMPCVITCHNHFLIFEVVKAIRGQKHHILTHTLALYLNFQFIPLRQFCLPKLNQEMSSLMTLSLNSASISGILEPSPQGLTLLLFEGRYCKQNAQCFFP